MDIEEFLSLGDEEPPKYGYPRLVRRAHHFSPGVQRREGKELLSELASLYTYIPAWRAGKPVVKLRRDVLALAEKYGAPYTDEENTLEAWLALATRVHIFMWGRRVLKEDGVEELIAAANEKLEIAESEGTQPVKAEGFSICDTRPPLRRFYVDLTSGEPREFRGMTFSTNDDLPDEFPKDLVWGEKIEALTFLAKPIIRTGIHKEDPGGHYSSTIMEYVSYRYTGKRYFGDEFLDTLGYHFYMTHERKTPKYVSAERYRRNIADNVLLPKVGTKELPEHVRFVLGPDGLILYCPVSVWADFKLAELWRNDSSVGKCPVCNTLFLPRRTNRKYCYRGSCAYKQHRVNKQRPTN